MVTRRMETFDSLFFVYRRTIWEEEKNVSTIFLKQVM